MTSESFVEIFRRQILKVDQLIKSLENLLKAYQEGIPAKKIESEFFNAEIRVYPLMDDTAKVIIRVEPKIDVDPEILSLLYLSELISPDEEILLNNVIDGRYKKLMIGNTIQLSMTTKKLLMKTEVKRILTKLKRAFIAILDPNIRKRLLEEKKRIDKLSQDLTKNKRDILISLMRINELLFYEAVMR